MSADIKALLSSWRDRPDLFAQEALGVKLLPWQVEAFRDVGLHDRNTWRSAHGVGKTTSLALLALWFISTRFPCKIPVTAPTAHQLEDVFWAELAKWFRRMPPPLRNQFELTSDLLYMKGRKEESFIVARTARREQPEALQGFHSENLLFLIDEASGIPDTVFEVAEGALSTPGAKVIMAANPTRVSGYFFDSHTRLKHLWRTRQISAFDVEGTPLFSPAYIESVKRRYGENSNAYRIRVLGEFPTGDDDAVIPLHLVTDAVDRDIRQDESDPIVWGVDCARFGDDRSTLCKRRKFKMLEPIKAWRNLDTQALAGVITREYKDTPPKQRPDEIMVDVIGIGSGVADRLRENGLPVICVNVSEAAAIGDKYFRQRDELWWLTREWFESRQASIVDDPELIEELTTPKYEHLGSGKIRVESKEDVKKRVLEKKSPDKADALILTFASQKMRAGDGWGELKYSDDAYYV